MEVVENDNDNRLVRSISSGTSLLWFEFLVDPTLLIPHLNKINPEPSSVELITKLLTVHQNVTSDTNADQEFTLRGVALKILSLKIAAFMKWDLNIFQSKLPLLIQVRLLENLMYITTGEVMRMAEQYLYIDINDAPNHVLFGAVLWHRWIISGLVHRGIQMKNIRHSSIQLPQILENNYPNLQPTEDFIRFLEDGIPTSLRFINNILESGRVPKMLTHESFVALTDNSTDIKQNWDAYITIHKEVFHCQLHFDLACFYFYKTMWKFSKKHFLLSLNLYHQISEADKCYTNVTIETLHGYLLALGEPINNYHTSLLYKFYSSIRNGFTGTITLMIQDNLERSLPVIHRRMLEIETMAVVASEKYYVAKDLLLQFTMLNVIRDVVGGETLCSTDIINCLNNGGQKAMDILLSTISTLAENGTASDCKRLQLFFIQIASSVKNTIKQIKNYPLILSKVFINDELNKMIKSREKANAISLYVNKQLQNKTQLFSSVDLNQSFELKLLQNQIITSYDLNNLFKLIQEWFKKSQGKPLWRCNPKWQLPIPLQSVVMSIDDSMMQNLVYIVLAKGRELMFAKDYRNSLRMYSQINTEHIRNSNNSVISKLWTLVSWELLLVKVIQYTDEWPSNYMSIDEKNELISKCKECLSTQQNDYTGNVIPRTEVVEHLSLFLLNISEWDFLTSLEKRWNYFELTTAVTYACQDLVKYKGTKKLNKEVWELILPVFGPSLTPALKRINPGNIMHRDSPNTKTKLNILSFMSSLRNEIALSVVIALLARLYNILKDESSLELIVENIGLWPAVISNANSYNSKSVSEMLWEVLNIALLYYPNNISWLKLQGDISFCNEYPEGALKCYIKSLIIATEYFSRPIMKPLIDDHTVKRMIKCCMEINCYTQAVVLCQFLDQIDYSTAFQCLGEMKPGNCQDAMDAYYNCIWDMTILEYLIYIHQKRGEEHRKREAIKIIGQLELNSNNSEEIKREASDIRKKKFMRAIAKQYVIKYPI